MSVMGQIVICKQSGADDGAFLPSILNMLAMWKAMFLSKGFNLGFATKGFIIASV